MFEYILIFITFILFVISVKKAGFFPFPSGLILFLAVSQVMLLLFFEGIVPYGMHLLYSYGGLQANYTTVQLIYTSTAIIALLTLIGKFKILKSSNLAGELAQLLTARDKSRFLSSMLMVLLCSFHFLLFLLLSDWDKLWLHHVYMEPYIDYDWVDVFGDELSDMVMRTTSLWAILSTLCVCRLIGTRHTFLKLIANAMSIFYFFLLLSLHSRAAAFVPVLLATNYMVLRLRRRRTMVPIMIFIAVVALVGALGGRETDRHGLSTLPETILSPFASLDPFDQIKGTGIGIFQVLMDLCQGAIVTAESLQPTGDFILSYKILAFSPFPSFIDGYSSIRGTSEHRLHEYVPMSGAGEVFHFGWMYACILLIGLTVLIRAHTRIAEKNPAMFILCNFLIMFSIYLLFSYPLRNSLRYYWIAVALYVGAVAFAKHRLPKDKRNALLRAAAGKA
jgi:hypothetical protein